MASDKNQRRRSSKPATAQTHIAAGPSSDDAHLIVYCKRHPDDDPDESCLGRSFLNSCPSAVRAKMRAVLQAVAAAPPKRFSGGGYREAMHDSMAGWFEIRIDGRKRRHYRLFAGLITTPMNSTNRYWSLSMGDASRSIRCFPRKTTARSANWAWNTSSANLDRSPAHATGDELRNVLNDSKCLAKSVASAARPASKGKVTFSRSLSGSGTKATFRPKAAATSARVPSVGLDALPEKSLLSVAGSALMARARAAFVSPAASRASSKSFTMLSTVAIRTDSTTYSRRNSGA